MKSHPILLASALFCTSLGAGEVPNIFDGLFKPNVPVKGQIGMVLPPPEINKYVAKVEAAAHNDKQWFIEFTANTKPGLPLPYHERLGITQAEYDEYLHLWQQREFKATEEVMLLLRQSSGNSWTITATGSASTLSTLRYHPDNDLFRSPNGELNRIEDINAEATSILGAWSGYEWKFEEETSLGKTKENVALGRFADDTYGLIVYRVQELTASGTRLLDKSLVIRFPLAKTTNE